MISWAVGFDGRVMGVVYDDTHQWLLGSCVKFFSDRGFGGERSSSKLKKQSL